MPWFPLLLATHIALAISLLLPSIVLPFLLRRSGTQPIRGLTRLALIGRSRDPAPSSSVLAWPSPAPC